MSKKGNKLKQLQSFTSLRKVEVLGKINIKWNTCLGDTTQSEILGATKCISEYSLEEFLIPRRFFHPFCEEMGCVLLVVSGRWLLVQVGFSPAVI